MTYRGLRPRPSNEMRFISLIMAAETLSVTVPQISMTRLNRSPAEIVPSR